MIYINVSFVSNLKKKIKTLLKLLYEDVGGKFCFSMHTNYFREDTIIILLYTLVVSLSSKIITIRK